MELLFFFDTVTARSVMRFMLERCVEQVLKSTFLIAINLWIVVSLQGLRRLTPSGRQGHSSIHSFRTAYFNSI